MEWEQKEKAELTTFNLRYKLLFYWSIRRVTYHNKIVVNSNYYIVGISEKTIKLKVNSRDVGKETPCTIS